MAFNSWGVWLIPALLLLIYPGELALNQLPIRCWEGWLESFVPMQWLNSLGNIGACYPLGIVEFISRSRPCVLSRVLVRGELGVGPSPTLFWSSPDAFSVTARTCV